MDTTIGYLELLREDLLDVAARTTRGSQRGRFGRSRLSGRAMFASAAVVTLLVAGTLGWLATRDAFESRPASEASVAGKPAATLAPDDERHRTLVESAYALGQGDATVVDQRTGGPAAQASGEASRVIRTARLGLVIPRDAFDERFAQAVDAAESAGGFVASSSSRERSGRLILRVPAGRFSETMTSLRDLGTVEVQSVRGKDVTATYVDLHARLRIARSRRNALLGLMNDAASIEQTIRVQNALDETQLRIEELQGQLRLLDDRTSLATIELDLREQGVEPEAEVEAPSIPNAFERAAAGFVGVIAGVVVGLGYLIPVVLLGLLAWFVVVRVRRRRAG